MIKPENPNERWLRATGTPDMWPAPPTAPRFSAVISVVKKVRRLLKKPHRNRALAEQHGQDLRRVHDRTGSLKADGLLAFVVCRNENVRLPYFLEYYRAQGVDHFFLIDNDSEDGTAAFVETQPDCSLWTTSASYKDSLFGVHWLNHLLGKYGTGHWCLTLDPDEFLIIPYGDTRDIKDATIFLDSQKKENLFSVMIDMYPEGAVDAAVYHRGQNPLEVAPWFDPTGYYQEQRPQCDWWIRGGVRRRVFFHDEPWNAPALNKTVLVKWKRHFVYVSSTHVLSPFRLNNPHFRDTLAPTGCLLHFKYLALIKAKIEEEMQRRQHYAGSREYQRYHTMLSSHSHLWCEGSARFENWRQLVDLGLMNTGRWF